MPRTRYTPEQVITKLRQAEGELARGQSAAEGCRKLGTSEQTYSRWRKEYGGLRVDHLKPPDTADTPPGRPRALKDAERLGENIAELAGRIQAANYELLVLIREFDERAGWGDGFNGFRSCAHWLNWRTGLDLGAAREKVRVARALAELPHLSAAMQRGDLSYSKVRALTRVATPANETELLDFARCATAA